MKRIQCSTSKVIMSIRRIHPVLYFAALAAFLLPVLAATSSIVLCQEWAGSSRIELVNDHGHCATTAEREHNHDAGGCECSAHPCKDIRLGVKCTPLLRSDQIQIGDPCSTPVAFVLDNQAVWYPTQKALFADSRELAIEGLLGQLVTVRLLL